MTRAFIIAATRTPVGRAGGALHRVSEHQLVAPLIDSLLHQTGLHPDQVDEVILGNAAGPGGNIARVSALAAGLPESVPGTSVDQQCSSALAAIDYAASRIKLGQAGCVIAGGVESVSTAPWRLSHPQGKTGMPQVYNRARFTPAPMNDPDMGVAAENVARTYHISRQAQDEYALTSHQRACAAADAGVFTPQITPIHTPDGIVDRDECPRPGLTLDKLARLKPAFVPGGTVTAGNSCPINDGAAVVMVVSAEVVATLGATRTLEYVDHATGAVDPELLGMAAVPACRRLLARHPELGMSEAAALSNIAVIEFNEAFASQTLASLNELSIDPARVNVHGGALALGHPYGASGAILMTHMFHQMLAGGSGDPANPARGTEASTASAILKPANPTYGLALVAAAGGVGAATLVRSG